MKRLDAVLFDKDGTLLDFHETWDRPTGVALRAATACHEDLVLAAGLLGFDLEADRIVSGSPMLAEPNDVLLALVADHLDVAVFERQILAASMGSIRPADGAAGALEGLSDAGICCAVVTNDWASVAAAQLEALGFSDRFVKVVGSDSGYGAKPDPGIVLGALAEIDVDPDCALLVGDTRHDMLVGREAGVATALVTNGSLPEEATADLADVVITGLDRLLPALRAHALLLNPDSDPRRAADSSRAGARDHRAM